MIDIDELTRVLTPSLIDVSIGDTGHTLPMVPMCLTDQLRLSAMVKADSTDVTRVQAFAIIACCPELSIDDIEKIMTWDKKVLTDLSEHAYKISGLHDNEHAEKN